MYRICIFGAFVVLCAALFPGVAQASILGSALTWDSVEDELQDNSFGVVVNRDGGGLGAKVSTGDVVYGALQVNQNNISGAEILSPNRLFAAFSFWITADPTANSGLGSDGDASTLDYLMAPTPVGTLDGGGSDVSLWGLGTDPDFRAALPLATWSNAAVAFVEDVDVQGLAAKVAAGGVSGALTDMIGGVAGPGVAGNPVGTGNWTLDFIGGFRDTGDYIDAILNPSFDLIGNILTASAGTAIGTETGGLNFLYDATGVPGWLDVNVTHLVAVGSPKPTTQHEIGFSSDIKGTGALADVSDNTVIRLNPTPEPATFAIWGILGLIGVAFGVRRRFFR